jgi:hypothetical protein
MRLDDFPARQPGRPSVVDLLPEEVRAQLLTARRGGSHSVSVMAEWCKTIGHPEVTASALRNYFAARGIGSGAGNVEP